MRRLIFANEKTEPISPDFVISDLKLDLILPPEVGAFLLHKPEKETLLLRREMFSHLLADESALGHLYEVKGLLSDAEVLYKAMVVSQSEVTAAYVFPSLLLKVGELISAVAPLEKYGTLFQGFCKEIADISSKNGWASAIADAAAVKTDLALAGGFSLKTDGENAVISARMGGGMADSLRACANELGVEFKLKAQTPSVLQKRLADALGKVYPDAFTRAKNLLLGHRTLISGELFDYIGELSFVIGIVELALRARENGLPVSFPELSSERKIALSEVYDVTLLKKEGTVIVPNDIAFSAKEPFFYLTGANGGGKTTFLRTVGVAMLLFCAGAPVFCKGGAACLMSAVYTHFPRDERFEGTGRFLDEKRRVDDLLASQDGNALVLLNETYSTTGEEKAIEETDILAKRLYASGNFGLYITHQHDVAEQTVPFLGVTVDENDSNRRTYKIEKRRLPPKSFAKDILEKYRLDKKSLAEHFGL